MSFTFGDLRSFIVRVQNDPVLIGRLLYSLHRDGTPEHWHYAQDSLKGVDYGNTNLGDLIVWFGVESATALHTRMLGGCDPVELCLFLSAVARQIVQCPHASCASSLGGVNSILYSWGSPHTKSWELRLEVRDPPEKNFYSIIEGKVNVSEGITDPI